VTAKTQEGIMTNMTDGSPRKNALAVFGRFLTAFTAADVDTVVGLFWPDALFWGTTRLDLVTTPDAVREYFKPVGNLKPNEWTATSLGTSTLVVSASVVLISGLWQIENVVDGKPTITPLRVSIAVTRRGDAWRIAQFHNSVRPAV
jgi:ketosteroid isomerase-like protein